ncbi:hypothetical protein [Amycolatopsis sp. NPDC051102]|uniref:hypothetical protein n=1 Tax=Amycolatopsis sp. NPDC051102 TaxID=3155163 RepID=UPI00344047C2
MTAARVLLSDGEVAWVRVLHPADAAAVRALHVQLSDRDRYYRFFGLGPAEAQITLVVDAPTRTHGVAGAAHRRRRAKGVRRFVADVLDPTRDYRDAVARRAAAATAARPRPGSADGNAECGC